MKFAEQPTFDHPDRTDIYDYVERHGSVPATEVRDALGFDERRFGHQLAILKRDGVLEVAGGDLRIAIDELGAAAEEFAADEFAFSIRPASQADLTGLVGVIRSVVEDGSYVVAESIADVVDHEEVLLRHNELEARMFFVATVDDDVVGWVHLRAPELDKLDHTAELTLGVLPRYRRHGIGSHLHARGLEWAASNGYERIYNSVPSTNQDAIDFLEAHGWEVEAVREDHYKLAGEYVDEVMLARSL
jgi:ribosomal protein S18 acetylase RimI-like enzyme